MANEKRLIDANAFIEALENADADVCETYHDSYCDWGFSRKVIEDIVDSIPTVDAVEVVRCKDCKRAENHGADHEIFCNLIAAYMGNDDFCSYGERKDNERKAD